jgi:DNA-binding MarR family transcriptional regulator
MQPPSRQPIGFWSVRAGEAIRARTRGALRELGVTQPEWWVLHQLSLHPEGVDRAAVVETIGSNDTPAAIESAIDSAIEKGWLRVDGTQLLPTAAGAERFERAAQLQRALQAERMEGITEEDFATAIVVLQKTIANVGGDAWHW